MQIGQNVIAKMALHEVRGQIKAITDGRYTIAVESDGVLTSETIEADASDLTAIEVKFTEPLSTKVELFKKGISEAPKFMADVEIKAIDSKPVVILTKEIRDRDGEIISVEGMQIENYLKNPILIDAHNAWGSVVTNVLGRIDNVRKSVSEDGYRVITGNLVFAPTPNGEIAKALVDGGFVKTVSIGFGVYDYDNASAVATVSELYETSLVSVPSNVGATINSKSLNNENDIVKALKNYKDIHPKIKEYRNFFMSNELCEKLGYIKTGDELIDIKGIYDLVLSKLETPVPQTLPQQTVATTTKAITRKELERLLSDTLSKHPII